MMKESIQTKHQASKAVLLRLTRYILRDRLKICIVSISILLSTILTVYAPTLLGHIVDRYILKRDISGTFEHLLYLALIYLVVSALAWVETYMTIQVSVGVVRALRLELFEKFQVLPPSYHKEHSPGDLMSRLTNDLDNLSTALSQNAVPLISSILTISGTIIAMLLLSWQLALISFIILPFLLYVSRKIVMRSSTDYVARQHALGNMNAHINEHILGAEVATLFNQEKEQWHTFNTRNRCYKKADFQAEVVSSSLAPFNRFFNNMALTLMVGVGAIMTVYGMATIGMIASFSAYSRQFFKPTEQLSNALNSLQAAYAGVKRVFEVLDAPNEFTKDQEKISLNEITEDIIIEKMSIENSKGEMVLKEISMQIPLGKRVAIIGPAGSGKTALLNYLNTFYDLKSGRILINNELISNYKKSQLRKCINSVPEHMYLFTGSILENIRLSNPSATDEEVIQAAKKVQAHKFINRLPEKYETMLYSNGDNLSQGERQLITIARAVLANPDVLILDQIIAEFNMSINLHILKALQEATRTKTLIFTTHNIDVLHAVDWIFVLKEGQLIQQGRYDDLLKESGFYRSLYEPVQK